MLFAGMALLLAGCAVAEVDPGEPLAAQGDEGLVVLSVTRSGWRAFDLLLFVKGPDDWVPRAIRLAARSRARDWRGDGEALTTPADNPEGRLVVLRLPPGEYRIDQWSGLSRDGGYHSDGYEVRGAGLGLTFTVEPGRTIYGGSIHLQLPPELNYLANITPAYYHLAVEDRQQRDLEALRAKHPNAAAPPPASRLMLFAHAGQPLRYFVDNYKAGEPRKPN